MKKRINSIHDKASLLVLLWLTLATTYYCMWFNTQVALPPLITIHLILLVFSSIIYRRFLVSRLTRLMPAQHMEYVKKHRDILKDENTAR